MSWLVIGAGISGLSAAQLIRSKGHKVAVSEAKAATEKTREALAKCGADLFDGGHEVSHLKGISQLVLSPGVRLDHPLVVEAKKRGIKIQSEIELALDGYKGFLIGVTGTNGKSTTTVMIEHILKGFVDCRAGGNLGLPPSAMALEGGLPKVLILELSSYQLELATGISPQIAVFTSFSHDHIQRHGSLEAYLQAKWNLAQQTAENGLILAPAYILNKINEFKFDFPKPSVRLKSLTQDGFPPRSPLFLRSEEAYNLSASGQLCKGKEEILSLEEMPFHETHNYLNAVLALMAAAEVLQRPIVDLLPELESFKALTYRCQAIGNINKNAIINDSKSTNVESTLVALDSQKEPVILLMGGQGKDESYEPILTKKNKIKQLYTFGASGHLIAKELSHAIATKAFPTLAAALDSILPIMQKNPSPLLFSPGCASFDEFQNFEHRGAYFSERLAQYLD